jgi:hypothetical protein
MTDKSKDETDVLVVEPQDTSIVSAITKGEVDVQVTTARRYPRSLTRFRQEALSLATLDAETAASCIYALPRKDNKTGQVKRIKGPSIRLAEILASTYEHIRAEGRPVGEDDGFVVCRGTTWDMQRNVLIAVETRRRITDRYGRRYSDDMVMMTTNANTSIALRNAILHVIPKAFWSPIYEAAVKVAVGDQKTLAERRDKAIGHFQKLGIQPAQIFAKLGVKGAADLTLEHLEDLLGLATAIKEGEISIDDAFREDAPQAGEPLPADLSVMGENVTVAHVIQAGNEKGWTPKQTMAFVKATVGKDVMALQKGAECVAAIKSIRESPIRADGDPIC